MPSKSRVAKQQNRFALTCSFGELKGLYPVHFSQLRTDPLADIDETDLLRDLQVGLERVAQLQGVEVSNHSEWSRFLGDLPMAPCEQRYADHRKK